MTRSDRRTNISNRPEVQNSLRNRRSNISASPDNRNINIDNRRNVNIDVDRRGGWYGGGWYGRGYYTPPGWGLVGLQRVWPLVLLSAPPRPITRRSMWAAPATFIPMGFTCNLKTTPTLWSNRPPLLW